MATINDYMNSAFYSSKNSMVSSFFGGSSDSTSNFLSDYASVKNGSYGKLLKAYYAKDVSSAASSNSSSSVSGSKVPASTDSAQKLSSIQSSASDLSKSTQALMSESLWEKKTQTAEDGTTSSGYDWDTITKAVRSFVKDYNNMMDTAAESDTKGVLRNAVRMTEITSSNSRLLSEAGIKIGEGNQLEVDTSKLKSAKITTLKSLFSDSYSFAGRIAQKASNINSAAGGKSLYTMEGKYSTTVTSAIATTVDSEI